MTASILTREDQSIFQIKASFLPSTVLHLLRADFNRLASELATTVQRAPNFFIGLPLIVDLEKVKQLEGIDFAQLKHILAETGLVPIGIRGGTDEQHFAALAQGWQVLPASKMRAQETPEKTEPTEQVTRMTKLVDTPIRSGMQVYAKEGDLIVTAQVSSGAELFADGNIHIYGHLRGRALAGVQGNTQARIFCRTLEAELISIAGYYLTREEIEAMPHPEGMMQIYLDREQIRIEGIK